MLVGEIMSRSQGSADAEDGSQGRSAKQDLRGVRTAVRMAQEMGARLGRGEVLFGAVPGGEGEGVGGCEGLGSAKRGRGGVYESRAFWGGGKSTGNRSNPKADEATPQWRGAALR